MERHTGSGTSSEYVVVRSSSSLRAACVGAWVWDGRMAKEVRVVEIHTTYSVLYTSANKLLLVWGVS